ncbi:hypothetical protein [Microbulbifer sp.]|nr:hypothetical protein [Microbulbifer sp.]
MRKRSTITTGQTHGSAADLGGGFRILTGNGQQSFVSYYSI